MRFKFRVSITWLAAECSGQCLQNLLKLKAEIASKKLEISELDAQRVEEHTCQE